MGQQQGTIATDGNMGIGTLFQAADFLEMEPAIPAHLFVTIGYPLDHPVPMIVARDRELTPSAWPEFDRTHGVLLAKDCPPSGQADAFLNFITAKLQPALEAEFDVGLTQWTLAGHSLAAFSSLMPC